MKPASEAQKVDFARRSVQPMASYTHPYLLTISGVEDVTSGIFAGTGFRLRLKGKDVIVTARHVVEQALLSPMGVACSAGSGRAPVHFPASSRGAEDVDADLSLLSLPADYPTGLPFWPEERCDPDPLPRGGDYLFVHGYPGRNTYFSPFDRGLIAGSLPYGVMERDDDLPPLRPWEFAVDFSPSFLQTVQGEAATFIEPNGLSGSPVWRIGAYRSRAEDWTPNDCTLVGVITKWNTEKQLLVATSVERLLALGT